MRMSVLPRLFILPVLALSLACCSMIEGRESAGQYMDDTTITTKVKEAFVADPQIKSMQINVETMKGIVQLSGFVDTQSNEARAIKLAQQVPGVKMVKDSMVLSPGPAK